MGKVGTQFLQGVRSLFGKSTSNQTPINSDIIQFNSTSDKWELVSGVVGNAVQSSSNVGSGDGLALPRVLDDLPFKTLVDGVEIVITVSATELAFSIGAIAISKITGLQVILDSKIETISNVGGFNEIALAKVAQNVPLRTLQAGTNITITQNANDLEISSTDTGEVNTASNVGSGVNVFLQKLLQDLEFRTLLANAEILITQNAFDLAFSIGVIAQSKITGLVSALATKIDTVVNVGAGVGKVFRDKVGTTINLKSILAGTGIVITNNADTIEIETIPQLSSPSLLQNAMDTRTISDTGANRFLALVGLDDDSGNEINMQTPIVVACKLRNMGIHVSANLSTGIGFTFTLRINGVDGNQSITVGAGATGFFQDTVNEDSIAVGDLVSYRFNKPAGGNVTFVGFGIEVAEA